ncbi:hypothetical protein L3X38_005072 [Prunus dulcis]|uniref:Reverse transcriptase Ty1/copia-type domain-containing protein n=1 Tax=Prunus dulcis TaxID=3755 RepID=A0AAD4ZQ79_PRUDU|nr:hypothetical protein L3X38_005072 [Prunus dulcis]
MHSTSLVCTFPAAAVTSHDLGPAVPLNPLHDTSSASSQPLLPTYSRRPRIHLSPLVHAPVPAVPNPSIPATPNSPVPAPPNPQFQQLCNLSLLPLFLICAFRIKRHFDGSIERYKALLVAKGFHQRPGIDYAETFSHVVNPGTIRIVLSLAVYRGWSLCQLDVKNAFLYGFLQEDVYMAQPPGFIDPTCPSYICKLHKALYGLKQATCAWFHRINGHFDIKDLGPLSYFLGLQVLHKDATLHIIQLKYAHDILQKANLLNSKPTSTLLAAKVLLSVSDGALISNPTEYHELIGSL